MELGSPRMSRTKIMFCTVSKASKCICQQHPSCTVHYLVVTVLLTPRVHDTSCFVHRECYLWLIALSLFWREREREREGEMANHNLVIDAWIKEAEEALKLVEGLENTIKNRNPEHFSLRSTAKSKLLELGVKLDRLESLLHNPPSKPNLYVLTLSSLPSSIPHLFFVVSNGFVCNDICIAPNVTLLLFRSFCVTMDLSFKVLTVRFFFP